MLKITIPGEPPAWSRAGVFGQGRKVRFYDKQIDEKRKIKAYLKSALSLHLDDDMKCGSDHFKNGAYELKLTFLHSPPASLPRKEIHLLSWGLLDKITKPDDDNLVKIVQDSGNEIIYRDDAQIVLLSVKKCFCNDGKPRTEIEIVARKKDKNVCNVLSEVHMKQIVDFCDDALQLRSILYDCVTENPENMNHSAIAYWLTKIAEKHNPFLKKLEKHKSFWHDLEAESKISGEGKSLC